MILTPGRRFKDALELEKPLQIVGTINAYSALCAQESGFKAIYLSGAGVANASFGVPDLALTSLDNVLEDARRITGVCLLPLLVDVDTGWGGAFQIARTIREMIRAAVAAIHLEDQVQNKRCGHRPGKQLVSTAEMSDRLKAALDARTDDDFMIIARTDAVSVEGVDAAVERAQAYEAVGANGIFAEAVTSLADYQRFTSVLKIPVLANLTEFGLTPFLTTEELSQANVAMALYPLSAFRAMSQAALGVYQNLRQKGSQQDSLGEMQTRSELYRILHYEAYERKLNELFGKQPPS